MQSVGLGGVGRDEHEPLLALAQAQHACRRASPGLILHEVSAFGQAGQEPVNEGGDLGWTSTDVLGVGERLGPSNAACARAHVAGYLATVARLEGTVERSSVFARSLLLAARARG